MNSIRSSSLRQINSTLIRRQHQLQAQQQNVKNQLQLRSKSTTKNTTPKENETPPSYNDTTMDPHQVADSMIRNSKTELRISGTEALNKLTPQQKMKNYVLALSLMGFVTGVWYYSILAVGKPEGGMEDFMNDANVAKEEKLLQSDSEKSAEELADLDVTMSQYGNGEDDDDIVVAVAADDDIAQMEEDLNMNAGNKGKGGRPLWKKVVFFWKKE
eukprot:227337_1